MTNVAETIVSEPEQTNRVCYRLSDYSINILIDLLLSISIKEENDAVSGTSGEAA